MTSLGRAALITAGAATGAFVADRAAKVAIERALDPGERLRTPLGPDLVRRTNRAGIAGAAPTGSTNAALLVAGGAVAAGVAGAAIALRRPLALQVGAGLIAGGMAGNLLDRARGGGVTDYLSTPLGVLNAADLAIAAGIVIGGLGLALR